MCGIVGIISNKNIVSEVFEGLQKLEYRGYDSAGISYFENNKIKYVKSAGKIFKLEEKVKNYTT